MSVFISYSRFDKSLVVELTCALDKRGVEHFLDEKDIEWGADFTEKIGEALRSCSAVLVVISPASLKSSWVPYEIGQAKALGKSVLPLLTHPSLELPGYLKSLNYKTELKEVLQFFDSIEELGSTLEEIHNRLRQDLSVSGAQRIEMIRQLANGPRKAAKRYLDEIASQRDFYSAAEIVAALAALQNMSEGKQSYDLMTKVELENPGNKVPGGPASLAATVFFWERPGSEGRNAAFEALMRMLKGD